jgi:hypothetical protein
VSDSSARRRLDEQVLLGFYLSAAPDPGREYLTSDDAGNGWASEPGPLPTSRMGSRQLNAMVTRLVYHTN